MGGQASSDVCEIVLEMKKTEDQRQPERAPEDGMLAQIVECYLRRSSPVGGKVPDHARVSRGLQVRLEVVVSSWPGQTEGGFRASLLHTEPHCTVMAY